MHRRAINGYSGHCTQWRSQKLIWGGVSADNYHSSPSTSPPPSLSVSLRIYYIRERGCRPCKDKLLALLGQECFNNEDVHLCVAETTLCLTSHKSFSLLKCAATKHMLYMLYITLMYMLMTYSWYMTWKNEQQECVLPFVFFAFCSPDLLQPK